MIMFEIENKVGLKMSLNNININADKTNMCKFELNT